MEGSRHVLAHARVGSNEVPWLFEFSEILLSPSAMWKVSAGSAEPEGRYLRVKV